MKKYAFLVAMIMTGCVSSMQSTKPIANQKQATLADFDGCVDVYDEARLEDLYFEKTKQALRFFQNYWIKTMPLYQNIIMLILIWCVAVPL